MTCQRRLPDMCLLVFARNCHPEYPLVVVANRDEFHDRAAEAAHWWPRQPSMLAGRDVRAGGTWMGVSQSGCWGAVTNYRDGPPEPAPRSRGDLVTRFLSGGGDPHGFVTEVAASASEYSGFSLIVGDAKSQCYFSNRSKAVHPIGDGIHTLSNHLLNTPWPKAELARLKLNRLLHKSRLDIEDLFAVLADSTPFADHELPTTGVGIEMERVLSPPFIKGDDYGTRCTTVFMVTKGGDAVFAEQGFLPGGHKGVLTLFEFPVRD